MKRNRIFVLAFCILLAAMLLGCTAQENITDISSEQAEAAASEIREQSTLVLTSAESVYLYTYPFMAEAYGTDTESMDAEAYFLTAAKLLMEHPEMQPEDENIINAMSDIGLDSKEGFFSMDSYTAGMSIELGKVPEKMQELIRDYDPAVEAENKYLQKAYEAYQNYMN